MGRTNCSRTRSPSRQIAELFILLQETEPLVWRRIVVPYDIPLALLGRVLIVAMGWRGYHLHAFEVDGAKFGVPDSGYPDGTVSEEGVPLRAIAPAIGATFTYQYDFGDNWEHLVTLERLLPLERGAVVPNCLEGARACPPEDVGGAGGYAEMVEALAGGRRLAQVTNDDEDPEDIGGEYTPESYRRWLGFDFDPDEFHLRCVNMELSRLLAFDENFQALLPDD